MRPIRRRRCPAGLPAVAALLCAAAAASARADATITARLGPDRPDAPGASHAPRPFDCAFVDTLVAAGDDTVTATTAGAADTLDTYACRPGWLESGPEHAYRLEVPARVEFSARLEGLGGQDLDLVLLGSCDTDDCLAQENTGFAAVLEPGAYVLIVDGYQGAAGPYALVLSSRPVGVPPQICADGGFVPIAPPDGGVAAPDTSLWGAPDLVRGYAGCSDLWHLAGEVWYRLDLPVAGPAELRRVTVTLTPADPSLDAALWVFDGCGEDAACLAFADDGIGGAEETLTLENPEPEPRAVWVGVDALNPPASEFAGRYVLQFGVTVPVERRTLGGVRSLFR